MPDRDELFEEIKDASAILADWAEEGGFESVYVDEQRAVILGAAEQLRDA